MNITTFESFINFCDDMMIANESKVIKREIRKFGNTNYIINILNLKIDGANICYEVKTDNSANINPQNDTNESVVTGVDEAFNAMKKEFDKIKLSMAEDIFKYMRTCVDNGDTAMQKKIDQYKNPQGLSKAIKPENNISYEYYTKDDIGIFRLSYDTDPYIDNNHCYTKIVMYDFKTKKLDYDENEYDG